MASCIQCCLEILYPKKESEAIHKPEQPVVVVQQPIAVEQPAFYPPPQQAAKPQKSEPSTGKVQFKSSEEIPKELIHSKAKLSGMATYIIDGDTFKFYHLIKNENVPTAVHQLKSCTFSIRLAGIDCPETPKQGKEGQPFGKEAADFLSELIYRKKITIQLQNCDQYNRIVATVLVEGQDVSIEMLRNGYAHLYQGKGACYGGKEKEMRKVFEEAKLVGKGIWSQSKVQTPSEYKKLAK
jgi:endonuclease YncB( thermonuclease family)